jgi:hypothetical protein
MGFAWMVARALGVRIGRRNSQAMTAVVGGGVWFVGQRVLEWFWWLLLRLEVVKDSQLSDGSIELQALDQEERREEKNMGISKGS